MQCALEVSVISGKLLKKISHFMLGSEKEILFWKRDSVLSAVKQLIL